MKHAHLINPKYMLPDGRWYDPGFDYAELKRLIALDIPDEGGASYIFKRSDAYSAFFKDKVTWRQAQELSILKGVQSQAINNSLNDEEKDYLRMKLAGVNNPLGLSILKKLGSFAR